MQMTNVIINFRRYLKRRNYSAHSVKNYLNILKQFVLWLDVKVEEMTPKKIDDYIEQMHEAMGSEEDLEIDENIIKFPNKDKLH